jgi:hypothetical protein
MLASLTNLEPSLSLGFIHQGEAAGNKTGRGPDGSRGYLAAGWGGQRR